MIMSKKHHKQHQNNPPRPTAFRSYVDCVNWNKKFVYLIVRGRKTPNKDEVLWNTIGSGFLAAPNRLITAAHVIENSDSTDEITHHLDSDKYYLIRHDDEGKAHWHISEFVREKTLFMDIKADVAVLYLKDSFYMNESTGETYVNKNNFIHFDTYFYNIGFDIGVLGYPFVKLEFENRDIGKPKFGDIILRTDKGVINSRYGTPEGNFVYEFTMAFNPGNSGGPIFDINTGNAISIVKGYKTIPIRINEKEMSDEFFKKLKNYKNKYYIENLMANYSFGFAARSYEQFLKQHSVIPK